MTEIYIVGAGPTASVAKMFFPKAEVIAPRQSVAPPLYHIWDTPYTRKFCKEFGIAFQKEVIVNRSVFGPGADKKKVIRRYNALTHKPLNSRPSEGKERIKVLRLEKDLPKARIDIKKLILTVTTKSERFDAVDTVLWCAPVDYTNFNPVKYRTSYSPITFVKMKSKEETFKSDYLYLFDDKYLDLGCYRVSKERKAKHFVYTFEVAGTVILANIAELRALAKKEFGLVPAGRGRVVEHGHVTVLGKKPRDIKRKLYFLGRYATCNHETLLSDTIEKLYKIRREIK